MRDRWVTRIGIGAATVALFATGVAAQGPATIDSTVSMSPQRPRPSWAGSAEIGLFPTAQHATPDVGQPNIWSGGLTLTLAYHLAPFLSIEAAGPITFNPNINGSSRIAPNFYSGTGSLVFQVPTNHTVQPYVLVGAGYDRYSYYSPTIPGLVDHLDYGVGHGGLGVRFRVSRFAALRLEANTDVGHHRPAEMAFLGISFFTGQHPSPPRIQRVVVTKQLPQRVDTLHVIDTVHVADTVHVREVRTQTDTNVILVLQDVNFGFGRSALQPAAAPVLSRLAQQLNSPALAGVPIEIRGYTDSIGSDSANYRLGLARAAAVRAQLSADGVDPNRLYATSGGKAEPVESNTTADGRARNRRVVIRRRSPG